MSCREANTHIQMNTSAWWAPRRVGEGSSSMPMLRAWLRVSWLPSATPRVKGTCEKRSREVLQWFFQLQILNNSSIELIFAIFHMNCQSCVFSQPALSCHIGFHRTRTAPRHMLRRCQSIFFSFFKPTGEIDGFSVIQGRLEKLWDTPEISPKGWRGNELQRTNLERHWREKN